MGTAAEDLGQFLDITLCFLGEWKACGTLIEKADLHGAPQSSLSSDFYFLSLPLPLIHMF